MYSDSVVVLAEHYGITPDEVLEASRWFDPELDKSIGDLCELMRDHKEIETLANIDTLLANV